MDIDDLVAVITGWGACPALPATCAADIAPTTCGNGAVDIDDLVQIIIGWGNNCLTGGSQYVGSLTSVSDCMQMATNNGLTPYSAEWNAQVGKCINALCAAQIIVCQ